MLKSNFPAVTLTGLLSVSCLLAGCGRAKLGSAVGAEESTDPFVSALEEAEPGDKPYLEAAKPVLAAVAARDWDAFYEQLSSHAKAKMNVLQFVQTPPPGQEEAVSEVVAAPTKAQFLALVARMEESLGKPKALDVVYVDETDPEILSGRGDRLSVMFAIGGMPEEIPANIRKAAVRARVNTHWTKAAVKQIAADLNISEAQVRSGKLPENEQYDDLDGPYLNFKFVFVEEAGQLKVGYFEFMPPSMLD